MRNYFIPHEGNNFLPHALHPKRLLFYALGSLAIKFIVAGLLLLMPLTAWLTPDLLSEQSVKIIELTNKIRAGIGVPALKENSILNHAAYNKAQDMLIRQYFSHVGPDNKKLSDWMKTAGYGFSVAGENLAMGFSSAEDVVNAWVASKTHYANLIDNDFTEIGVGMASGLYEKNETTLVAQYFGTPTALIADTPAPKPVAPKILPAEPAKPKVASEKLPLASASAPEAVKKEEEKPEPPKPLEPLAKPAILKPGQTYTNKNETDFEIFTPKSEWVQILDDEKEIYSGAKTAEEDYFKFSYTLEEGLHKFRAVAARGDQSAISEEKTLTVDLSAPAVDQGRTQLIVSSPAGKKEKLVLATAYLSPDTAKARVNFSNYQVDLVKDETDPNKWEGSVMIFDDGEEEIFNPVVLASLTASDYAGNEATEDVNWKNIIPVKTSLLNQYFFIKSNQSAGVKRLFDISSVYYAMILVIACITLLLNIFVNIRKQHPHIIIKTLGLIGLLVILIII